ncbi:MAG TPA: heme ABC exporter ATP-binding protein CcmA [Alphaproteobacteria bacterium]|nr:heme ABC exporter ATP-binding protein CcmA [Alphaproteobacteria bacterium]
MPEAPAASFAFAGKDLACLRGGRLVFAHLSFRLEPGDALVLKGPNGSGKSTLLRLMAGLIRPFAGSLAWEGAGAPTDESVAYVGHADAVKPTLSALENLSFWAALADPREAFARARMALADAGLDAVADLPGRYLSAGQRRRLALARLHAAPAGLWLLDEPTVGLDRAAVVRLEAALARHLARGGMAAVATHTEIAVPGARALDLADFSAVEEMSW